MLIRRFKNFGIHLAVSIVVAGSLLAGVYFGWYGDVGAELLRPLDIVGLVVFVDIVIGPLATFIVSSAEKSTRQLRLDVSIIAFVQIVAFVIGFYSLWTMRPLYYVFSDNRIEIIRAGDLEQEDIERARSEGSPFAPSPFSRPRWVWAPMPEDPAQATALVSRYLTGGKDIAVEPIRYKDISLAQTELRRELGSVAQFETLSAEKRERAVEALAPWKDKNMELAYLPIQSRGRTGILVFDSGSLRPLEYVDAELWPPRQQ